MSWDGFQRDMLDALGHAVYRLAPAQRPAIADNALLHALLRAAGRDVDSEDAWQLSRTWPATSQLRGNAAAKRALWPQLRMMRKRTPA